jgi:hypothetical protein
MTSLHRTFSQLSDPRIDRKKQHSPVDIIILSILAVLSGVESFDSIELFGKRLKAAWNKDFLIKLINF